MNTHNPFLSDSDSVIERDLSPALLGLDSFGNDIIELSLGEQWPCADWLLGVWRDGCLDVDFTHDVHSLYE